MKPFDRQAWILDWLRRRSTSTTPYYVDVLNSDFVLDYVEATGAKCAVRFFGAPGCPQLGRDLGAMHAAYLLKRHATGLSPGDAAMGFPKWVYSYRLAVLPSDER
jgi:hypothetical protein